MLKKKTLLLITLLATCAPMLSAQDQQAPPTPEEMAEAETERLESLLKLEDWQVFFVDSTLRNDYSCLMREMQDLQRSQVSNYDNYMIVQDKWMERTQAAYRKFFTDSQWERYLKTGGQRIINEREKRRAKIQKANEKLK